MGARIHVLVASDAQTAAVVRSALSATCECELVSSPDAALASLARGHVDVVVAEDRLGRMRGLDLFDAARARHATVPFILIGVEGGGDADAADARRHGIFDYVTKPVDGLALSSAVERAAIARQHREEPATHDHEEEDGPHKPTAAIIGSSPRFLETLAAVNRIAQSSAPVLLVGETGTGKDLLASRIHALGSRCHRPFVVVNAAALPATLLDSELFGHAAGSFTGASRARRGLISEADGGTVFLDEIADLPIELQGRLLRVIETGAIRSVGSDHERTVDVRFIAATQEPLSLAVAERRFREDLFYRLNILSVRVPPLRDRRDDIPALVAHFFKRARARTPHSPVTEITPDATQRLVQATWPGNVRELAAVIERLVVFGRQSRVEVEDLDALDEADGRTATESTPDGTVPTLRELSLRHVESVLARTHGDKASAAGILGIDVSTLYRWQRRNIG
jgi:two-component system response regulator HydG